MNKTKTVVSVDLHRYDEVVRWLNAQFDAKAVLQLNAQIQNLIDKALARARVTRKNSVIKETGDGAILAFEPGPHAHNFSEALHRVCREHNHGKYDCSACRWFRVGVATGDLAAPVGLDPGGAVINRATRLQAAGKIGEVLIDPETYDACPKQFCSCYSPEELIDGKNGEKYRARRNVVVHIPPPVPAAPPTNGNGALILSLEFTMEGSVTDFNVQKFKTALDQAGIDSSQIHIVGIRQGSIKVTIAGENHFLHSIIRRFESSIETLTKFAAETRLIRIAWEAGGEERELRPRPVPVEPRPVEDAEVIAEYIRATRRLWEIIDLAGLPEGELNLAMTHFLVRELYVPLSIIVESDENSLKNLESRRERERLAAAGRQQWPLPHSDGRRRLGNWLDSLQGVARVGGPAPTAPRLVILGDPGSGKTTLLRWFATACLLRLENSPELKSWPDLDSLPVQEWLPIPIQCRNLRREQVNVYTLEDLLRQAVLRLQISTDRIDALVSILQARLKAGRAILLVDGLDEITEPNLRIAFCRRIEEIARQFVHAPILVTSRIVGYREMHHRLGHGFSHGTLADLSPSDQDTFIRHWCKATIPDQTRHEDEENKLRHSVHQNERIERLVANPMLLTTLALVQRKCGKLPNRRHRLYWEAVGVLLNWTDYLEGRLEQDEALPQLEYIAYEMCHRGVQKLRYNEMLHLLHSMREQYPNIYSIHERTPREFIAEVARRTGLLMEVGEEWHNNNPEPVYEFRHLTFQEYLAARALVKGHHPGHQANKTLAERITPLAGNLVLSRTGSGAQEALVAENWREVLRLCVASCEDDHVDAVLTTILETKNAREKRARSIQAALCLADEPNVSPAIADDILRGLAQAIEKRDGNADIRTGVDHAVMEVAGSLWWQRLEDFCTRAFMDRTSEERVSPGLLSGMIAIAHMPFAQEKQAEWMQQQVQALQQTNVDATKAALAIMRAAFDRRAVLVPHLIAALTELLKRGRTVADAAAWALYWLAAPKQGIPGIWKPTPEEFSPLNEYLINPDASFHVLQSLVEIAEIGKLRAAAAHCFLLAAHHSHLEVRVAALVALGVIGDKSTEQDLGPWLKDPDVRIRSEALGAMAILSDDAQIMRLLSVRFNGVSPWLDPQHLISLHRVQHASDALGLHEGAIMDGYRRCAARYGLKTDW
jgi:hypothetical protein